MADMVKIDTASQLRPGTNKVYTVRDHEVAVFNVDESYFAIDDHCPHRGASLGTGTLVGTVVTCPWHDWTFELESGKCVSRPGSFVRCYDVVVEGGDLSIDASPFSDKNGCDGIYRYLVRYGAMGWIGRFGSIEHIECGYKDRVIVQTERGTEVGEVLAAPGENGKHGDNGEQPTGELLRRMTPEDEQRDRQIRQQPMDVEVKCQRLLSQRQLQIEVIDGERLFDEQTMILYYLGDPSPELDKVAKDLRQSQDCQVSFQPVIEPTVTSGGCGLPGCGGGGCHAT